MAPTTPAPGTQTVPPSRSASDPRKLLYIMLFLVVGNLFLLAVIQVAHRVMASLNNQPATTSQPATVAAQQPPMLPCQDSWKREAQGIGDHRKEDITNFNVRPMEPGCLSGLIYAPSDWSRWSKMVVAGTPDCLTWFQPFGSERPLGPFKPNELPEFPVTAPHPWRVSTECTLKYFQKS